MANNYYNETCSIEKQWIFWAIKKKDIDEFEFEFEKLNLELLKYKDGNSDLIIIESDNLQFEKKSYCLVYNTLQEGINFKLDDLEVFYKNIITQEYKNFGKNPKIYFSKINKLHEILKCTD